MGWVSASSANNKMDINKLNNHFNHLKLHHFGFVCKDIDIYKEYFLSLHNQEDFYLIHEDNEQNVRAGFIKINDNLNIELLEVLDENKYSPIKNFLIKNNCGYHHLCYETISHQEAIDNLKSLNMRLISNTKNGFEGRNISFFIPKKNPEGPLVEIVSVIK